MELGFYGRRLINMTIRYTMFLFPSQIRRSKPEEPGAEQVIHVKFLDA